MSISPPRTILLATALLGCAFAASRAEWRLLWRHQYDEGRTHHSRILQRGAWKGSPLLLYIDDQELLHMVDRGGSEEPLPSRPIPDPYCSMEGCSGWTATRDGLRLVALTTLEASGEGGSAEGGPEARLVAIDGTVLAELQDVMQEFFLSDDGRTIVSILGDWGWDEEARVFDGRGSRIASILDDDNWFSRAGLSPDGRILVYGSGRQLVARSRRGRLLWVLDLPCRICGPVTPVAVARRGRYAAYADVEGPGPWRFATLVVDRRGRPIHTLPYAFPIQHPEEMRFTSDSRHLLIRERRAASLTNMATGRTWWSWAPESGCFRVEDADASRDGGRVALSAVLDFWGFGHYVEYHPADWPVQQRILVVETGSGEYLLDLAIPRDDGCENGSALPGEWGPEVDLSEDGRHLLVATWTSLSVYVDE